MNVHLRRSGPGLWPRSRTTALLWNENVHLGKPLLSCHAAQRQEPAWHLAIRGLAEHILSVKQREGVCEKKTLSKIWYQTEVTCIRNLCDALWLLSYIFNHIYSAKNILIFYFSSLSGPFYKLSGLKHHYAFFTRSHIPYWLPFKSISSETRFWKSPQLRGMLNKSLFCPSTQQPGGGYRTQTSTSTVFDAHCALLCFKKWLVVMSQLPGFLNIN